MSPVFTKELLHPQAQYKVLQEKLSQHISIDGEGSVQTQLGQKVLIGGKQYNVQKVRSKSEAVHIFLN